MDIDSIIFDDDTFEADMAMSALPLLSACRKDSYTPSGLFCSVFENENQKCVVTVSHGFSEGMHKYREFIYILLKAGCTVVIYEHRGHGRSIRCADDMSIVHIDDFGTYIEDLKHITDEVSKPLAAGMPMYLFGHSMGGCIATLFQETYPAFYDKLVLSSPMLGIKLAEGFKAPFARKIAAIAVKAGKAKDALPSGGEKETFETSLTTSRSRYDYTQKIREANVLLQTSSPSFGWAYEALKASRRAMKNRDKLASPVLLFQAEDETMVSNREEDLLKEKNSNVSLVPIKGSRHEILLSPKSVLTEYYKTLFSFLKLD